MLRYQRMKFGKILRELDSEEKARAWIWLAKLDLVIIKFNVLHGQGLYEPCLFSMH